MPTVKTELRELSDIQVRFISLVKRGANRLPIRVIKSHAETESDMIDLTNVVRVLKGEKKPKVTAVIVNKTDAAKLVEVQKALADAGFDLKFARPVDADDENSPVLLTKTEGEELPAGHTMVGLSKNVVAVMKGFDCYGEKLKGLSFSESADAQGFYSDISTAFDVLRGKIWDEMYAASDANSAADAIRTHTNDFAAYIATLITALPMQVFKAEKAITAVLAKADEAPAPAATTEEPAVEGEGAPATEATEVQKDDAQAQAQDALEGEAAPVAADPAAELPAAADEAGVSLVELQKTVAALAEGLAGLNTLGDTIKSLSAGLEEVRKSQQASEKKIDEVVQKTETATRAVQGTLVASAPDDTASALTGRRQVRKTEVVEEELDMSNFDSAFQRRPGLQPRVPRR